jgi:Domain of unknown function (DUF4760)
MKNSEFRTSIRNSGLIFFGSLALLFLISLVWNNFKVDTNLTNILEAISSAIAAAAVFGAAYFAYQELDEISKSRHIEVADRLFDELNSPKSIEARRRIFQSLKGEPDENFEGLSREDRDAIKTVLNSLDRVAFLTQSGWIPDELVMPWMHPMIFKSWEKLKPYVDYERKLRGESYFYKHAEMLALRCIKWRKVNLPQEEQKTHWINTAL